ncbi:hypothetical protein [Pseudomonas gingeri]|nr:hypothetical protein [Pseudomonas gingeri]
MKLRLAIASLQIPFQLAAVYLQRAKTQCLGNVDIRMRLGITLA